MNTNMVHNAINIIVVLIAALETFDWTSLFSAETAIMVVGTLSFSKLLINFFRDGITGLIKEQPPVK